MNTMQAILAAVSTPRVVTIHVRNHAEFVLVYLTQTPVWPTKAVQS